MELANLFKKVCYIATKINFPAYFCVAFFLYSIKWLHFHLVVGLKDL